MADVPSIKAAAVIVAKPSLLKNLGRFNFLSISFILSSSKG